MKQRRMNRQSGRNNDITPKQQTRKTNKTKQGRNIKEITGNKSNQTENGKLQKRYVI